MTVHIGAVFIFFKHLPGYEACIRTVQEHPQGRVHGQYHDGKLANQVGKGIDNHKEVTHMIVLPQPLEGVIGAVCHQVRRDMAGIKHHPKGNGPKYGGHCHHKGQGRHPLGEIPGRVLHLINIGGYFLTSAHCEDQDGKPHEETGVKGGDEGL